MDCRHTFLLPALLCVASCGRDPVGPVRGPELPGPGDVECPAGTAAGSWGAHPIPVAREFDPCYVISPNGAVVQPVPKR
jgi:hypothetical protein